MKIVNWIIELALDFVCGVLSLIKQNAYDEVEIKKFFSLNQAYPLVKACSRQL